MTTPDTESSDSNGEAELTLDAGGCRVVVRGPELPDDPTRWGDALKGAFTIWERMFDRVHSARLEEIRAEQGGRVGPASAGFIQEGASEARNQTLPGGNGVRPV